MKDLPVWISAAAAIVAIPISIWAIIVSKQALSAVQNITNPKGPAGIVQSGGTGMFSVGEMRVGQLAQNLAKREFGLEKGKTSFSTLTNAELKQRTLDTVLEIRKLILTMADAWRENSPFTPGFFAEKSNAEKEKMWLAHNKRSEKDSATFRADYNSKFRIDTILLRDEIRARLPKAAYPQNTFYEEASISAEFQAIADELEMLAKKLPL